MSSSKRPSKKPTGARGAPRAPQIAKSRGPAPRAASTAKKSPPKVSRPATRATPKPAPAATARPAPLPIPKPLPARPASPTSRTGIRLPGSASSRLTIKPSPSQGPRPQLQLSTKVRPGGSRRLSEVELDEDEVLIDGFDATLAGETVRITAVLERTCVYVDRGGDRRLAKKEELWVEANKLPIRRRGLA